MNQQFKDIDINIAASLEKLAQVQRVLLWDVAKKENLSPIQIQFMIFLNRHSDDLRRVSVLAKEFDLTKATVSDAISNLVEKGLLVKNSKKEDKRSFNIDLTSKGKGLLKKLKNWQDILLARIYRLSNKDKETIYLFLIELIKHLFDEGVINVARMCTACSNLQKESKGKAYRCDLTGRRFDNEEINFNCNYFKSSQ